MNGKTKSGFEYSCDDRIFSDWRFTMAVSKTQSGTDLERLAGAEQMIELLLGRNEYDRLLAHIASKNDGFVPAETVMAEVTEILNSNNESKN